MGERNRSEEIRVWVQDDPFYDLKIGKGLHCRRMPLGMTEDIDAMEIESDESILQTMNHPEYGPPDRGRSGRGSHRDR